MAANSCELFRLQKASHLGTLCEATSKHIRSHNGLSCSPQLRSTQRRHRGRPQSRRQARTRDRVVTLTAGSLRKRTRACFEKKCLRFFQTSSNTTVLMLSAISTQSQRRHQGCPSELPPRRRTRDRALTAGAPKLQHARRPRVPAHRLRRTSPPSSSSWPKWRAGVHSSTDAACAHAQCQAGACYPR